MSRKNPEVSLFLDDLHHPLRNEIEELRGIILDASELLAENFKWNGPNNSIQEEDRITLKIQPPKQLQLIFHRGAKKLTQPVKRLIQTESKLLTWKENDRAVAPFKNLEQIEEASSELKSIVKDWVLATSL